MKKNLGIWAVVGLISCVWSQTPTKVLTFNGIAANPFEDGGPVHPTHFRYNAATGTVQHLSYGITLRDHFAILALQGIISRPGITSASMETEARIAYGYADVMLKVRAEQHNVEQ